MYLKYFLVYIIVYVSLTGANSGGRWFNSSAKRYLLSELKVLPCESLTFKGKIKQIIVAPIFLSQNPCQDIPSIDPKITETAPIWSKVQLWDTWNTLFPRIVSWEETRKTIRTIRDDAINSLSNPCNLNIGTIWPEIQWKCKWPCMYYRTRRETRVKTPLPLTPKSRKLLPYGQNFNLETPGTLYSHI